MHIGAHVSAPVLRVGAENACHMGPDSGFIGAGQPKDEIAASNVGHNKWPS